MQILNICVSKYLETMMWLHTSAPCEMFGLWTCIEIYKQWKVTCGLLCLLRAVVTRWEFLVKYMSWYEQILGVTRLQDVASHHSSSAPRDWLSIDWPTDSFVNQPIDALKTTPCQPSQRVKVYKCYPYSSSRYPNVLNSSVPNQTKPSSLKYRKVDPAGLNFL